MRIAITGVSSGYKSFERTKLKETSIEASTTPQQIAVLGGTFDPVHNGHLRLALDVLELGFDEVRLLPNPSPPHRSRPTATAEHRLAMLKLAVQDEPRIQIDTTEMLSGKTECYSFDSVRQLYTQSANKSPSSQFDNSLFTWVMGSDVFCQLNKWYRWQDFVDIVKVLVLLRPGYPLDITGELALWYGNHRLPSTADLLSSKRSGCYCADLRVLAISATEIRNRVAEGLSTHYLLPEAVEDYISQYTLYQTSETHQTQ